MKAISCVPVDPKNLTEDKEITFQLPPNSDIIDIKVINDGLTLLYAQRAYDIMPDPCPKLEPVTLLFRALDEPYDDTKYRHISSCIFNITEAGWSIVHVFLKLTP